MKDFLTDKRRIDGLLQNIFLIICFFFVSTVICFDTELRNIGIAAKIFSVIRLSSYLVVVLKIVIDFFLKKFSCKELIIVAMMSGLLLLSCGNAASNTLFIYWAFSVASHDANYKNMSKVCLFAHIFALILIFGLCLVGILPDNINVRGNGAERHSFGFFYGGLLSHFVMYTILLYLYVRNESLKIKEVILLILLTMFVFVNTDTKSPFALSMAALLLSCVLIIFRQRQTFNRLYKVISVIVGPISVGAIGILSLAYNNQSEFLNMINRAVSGRLALGKQAFAEYGVTAFGQRISWSVGGSGGYNYVDSSYLKALFDYGIVFEILIVVVLASLGLAVIRKKDVWALLCLLIVCLHSMFDDQLLWLGSDSFMLCAYPYLKSCFGKPVSQKLTCEDNNRELENGLDKRPYMKNRNELDRRDT